jgi:hypothetical protein
MYFPAFQRQIENSSPIKVFRILVDNDIFKIMQEETNLYTKGPLKKKSVFAQWKPVTLQELEMFCAVIIHMSVLQKPSMHE